MPDSVALQEWRVIRCDRLDEIEAALQQVGGGGRGRRFTTQQMNRAYAVLLAAQFQRFCGDLHAECVAALVAAVPANINLIVRSSFLRGRLLDKGNAHAGSMGSDFGQLGIELWPSLKRQSGFNIGRQKKIEHLNKWRNAIAHDDFSDAVTFPSGRMTILRLSVVREWRQACHQLAISMDQVLKVYVHGLVGVSPW